MEKINIAIADDNERMQEMLGNVIKQDDTLELIGQTGNGNDIYSIIRDKEPDVVLLDIFMPKMDGLTVMEKVNEDKNLKKRKMGKRTGLNTGHIEEPRLPPSP